MKDIDIIRRELRYINEILAMKDKSYQELAVWIFNKFLSDFSEKEIKSSKDVNVYELIAILSGTRSEGFVESMLNSMLKLYDKRNELLNNVTENNHKIKTIDNQIETKKRQILNYLNVIIKRLEQNRKNYSEKVQTFFIFY